MLPEKEITLKENKPITHKFICPIDAYAITLLISDCIAADIDVYITERMHKVYTKELKYMVALKKKGIKIRIKPYAPILSKMAAKITEPSVGDSTCASGNHKCIGNIGILILKDIKKHTQSKYSIQESYVQYHNKGIIEVPESKKINNIENNIKREPPIV